VIRPVEFDGPVSPVVACVAALSLVPTTSVQPDQAAGPRGSKVPWVSDLLSELSEVVWDPLNIEKGTLFLQSQGMIFLRFG
jgi:hypothetical protein